MDKQGLKYTALAPTNKACRVIKGQTIHKFASGCRSTKALDELKLDYIIVDEISMVPEMFYKFFLSMKRIKPKLKFIIAGDFEQLLPVKDRVEGCDYKGSHALWELCDGQRLQLSNCRRSDQRLFNKLRDELPEIKSSDFNKKFTERHLSFTNEKRKWVNSVMMDREEKKASRYKTKIIRLEALPFDKNSQDVKLTKGTPIIAKKNDKYINICNNECFTIVKIDLKDNFVKIKEDGGERELNILIDDFQKLFFVAWCITIHKSQGSTFDHEYTIHEMENKRFDNRLKYVALSRSTNIEHIKVW
jgi:ATP-dependent exoDNAse (exonuclease V) alpha subunit